MSFFANAGTPGASFTSAVNRYALPLSHSGNVRPATGTRPTIARRRPRSYTSIAPLF